MKNNIFHHWKIRRNNFWIFTKICKHHIKWNYELWKDYEFVENPSNEECNFALKKWYVIDTQTAKGKYNPNDSIKFETESIKWSPCDYSDAFILVTRDITLAANNNTDVVFKNCPPFSTCKTEINEVFIDEANHIYTAILMYNLIEYSDNYSDTSV